MSKASGKSGRQPRTSGRSPAAPAAEAPSAGPAAPAKADAPAGPLVVGIDLGTTNTAVAWVDPREAAGLAPGEALTVRTFEVPQLVRAGTVQARPQLASALYLPGPEVALEARALPFAGADADTITGAFALEQGARVPRRLVVSAKSWLCHAGVDRRAPILPWSGAAEPGGAQGDDDVAKLSPFEAARRLLLHVRAAWDHEVAKDDPSLALARQEVLLTVPASFDPMARELTLEAAQAAGLARVTLLEEPLAAFYAWLERAGDGWRRALRVGDLVLVVDVGGGTTDLTLIAVRDDGQGGLALERVAVGEHLLLGGDNMDLALAHLAAERLAGQQLDPWQSRTLWLAARQAKEALLLDPARDHADVVVPGRGSKLVGGTLKATLAREEVERVVVGGFFPACGPDERPRRRRAGGLAELGLPFEPDAAITRHLAAFLARQAGPGAPPGALARPTAVLFNGGVFKAPPLRAATLAALASWAGPGAAAPAALEGEDLDLAVARGAAYYGLVRRGRGVRIRGGTARTYYVGVESALPAVPGLPPPIKALCVAPRGMEEGTEVELPGRELSLLVGEPAEFRFLSSTSRKDDRPGAVVERWAEGELAEHAPVQVTLPAGGAHAAGDDVPVTLRAAVTETGTLELHCVARTGERYRLSWNVREQDA